MRPLSLIRLGLRSSSVRRVTALRHALALLCGTAAAVGPVASSAAAPAVERRRPGAVAYHADAYGDRLVGYDGARRVSWVERLDRPPGA